jgi:predicted GIY-YIG superfamily endonuclease
VEPVYREAAVDRSAATRREMELKSFSRQAKLALIE